MPTTDRFSVRAVIILLGVVALAALTLGGLLALNEKSVPDFIVAMGAGSLSALGALLARTGTESSQVQISNTPANPVPVEDSDAL